ncbi:MAG TPA: GNAT family N-acetyltransferase [Gemmatimonadaceae bacterium]|nr:GNAT family N-acetyltransferase [Gemmatimonadaceae bacterium]
MAFVRNWRHSRSVSGPITLVQDDIPGLNRLFSDSFTERYRKDGLVGVRVPHLNPKVWMYAIADAGRGALGWRGEGDRMVAFNLVHSSGAEGWMGPLAVDSDYQGAGLGKTIVTTGLEWLKARQTRVIGLETMPRTVENVGFYSGLGFVPANLTITLTLDVRHASRVPTMLGALSSIERDVVVRRCADLLGSITPGYDFTREIELTSELDLGDTVLLTAGGELRAFALCHTAALADGRARDELRVLKLVARDEAAFDALLPELDAMARRVGTRRVAIRVQGAYSGAYRLLMRRGARVRWTDLRMTAFGHAETIPAEGIVFSNWEI